jgi:4-carboxymuconolactone decarboxylase
MARVPDLVPERFSPQQKRIHDEIAGTRGGTVRGPFAIWLRLPEVADQANQFGNALRLHGKLEKRLFELMVLIVARHWSAQYEWFAHEKAALKTGISAEIVESLRAGRRPAFANADEALVYDIVSELNDTRALSQGAYGRGVAALGLELMIELVTAAGFYTMVAMMLNAFDAPVPGGERPLP